MILNLTERFPLADVNAGDGAVVERIAEDGELVLGLGGRADRPRSGWIDQVEAHELQRVRQPDQRRLVAVQREGDDLVAGGSVR